MANEVGSANNLEDLFGKIVSFLTTNATLVAANQHWQVLRQRRDNILTLTSNLTDTVVAGEGSLARICRYDTRQLNTDLEQSTFSSYYSPSFIAGSSFIQWRLRVAKDVVKVRVRAPLNPGYTSYALKNFRLQYSDNGSSWTTALTVTPLAYSLGEWRDFTFSSVGSHEYWRIIVDSTTNNSNLSIASLMLLTADETVANHFGSEVILKARGNAAADEIFTGIRSEYDAAGGWYNLFLNGYTGFDINEKSWFKQPGALPGSEYLTATRCTVPMVPCWDTTMPYWFSASGRSFRMGLKVSTNYEGCYLGFFLPYATPGQYPYPLVVGGSLVPSGARTSTWRYSTVSYHHGVFPGPGGSVQGGSEQQADSTLYVRGNDGVWRWHINRPSSSYNSESLFGPSTNTTAPYAATAAIRSVWPHCMNDQWGSGKLPYRECLGGGYILQPVILLQNSPSKMVHGELEGIYSISGYENSPENTLIYNSKTVTVFQNAYRNTIHEFWALSLD